MLDEIRRLLDSGQTLRAREHFAGALSDLFRDSILEGVTDPPFFTRRGRRFLEEARPLAPLLVGDSSRGAHAVRAIDDVFAGLEERRDADRTLFLANYALQLLVPDFASRVEEAIQDAKFELGRRASNVDGGLNDMALFALSREALVLKKAIEHGFQNMDHRKFDRIEDLRLAHLDAPEHSIPDLPAIEDLVEDEIVFACPVCRGRRTAPLGRMGDADRCDCGHRGRVPIPGLVRMAAYLKARREAASGIARCRVCRAVVQKRGDPFMRAGFCSALCARRARELFREYVPRDAVLEGDELVVSCHCGGFLRAAAADSGSRLPCAECGLDVWIPPAPAVESSGSRHPGVVSCPTCGRPVKKTAPRCLWCGAPLGP